MTVLFYIQESGTDKKILDTIDGNWKIDVEIDEKMYNRQTLIYELEYCNDENLELISASVSETGMKIKCKTIWGEPVYLESDSEEEKQRKKREFFDRPFSVSNVLIQNDQIANDRGKVFYPSASSDGDGLVGQQMDGTLIYWQTFNLTKADATDTLTIAFTKGGEWKKTENEEVIIKLSRVK